jgi:dolichol-phosphate mannosyltransferase
MISVIIPVYDEVGSLVQLHRELDDLAAERGYELQFVLVDDGSTDGSWAAIARLAEQDARVLGIRFRRNFGKAAALSAGFDAATGDVIVTMDADLQDSPAEIPKLLARLDEGLDVVSGWKQLRRDPWHKRWPSKAFNWLVGRLTGVKLHDHNCGLKAFRRDVIHEIRLYGELHRFVPVLAAARGFRVGETVVEHRPRVYGRSKYGLSRIPKGLLDLLTVRFITRFGQRPQHWLGSVGLVSMTLGLVGMTYLAVVWVWSRLPGQPVEAAVQLHNRPLLLYSAMLAFFGINLVAIGFVAEMIAALVSRDRDEFSIAQYTAPREPARSSQPNAEQQEAP